MTTVCQEETTTVVVPGCSPGPEGASHYVMLQINASCRSKYLDAKFRSREKVNELIAALVEARDTVFGDGEPA